MPICRCPAMMGRRRRIARLFDAMADVAGRRYLARRKRLVAPAATNIAILASESSSGARISINSIRVPSAIAAALSSLRASAVYGVCRELRRRRHDTLTRHCFLEKLELLTFELRRLTRLIRSGLPPAEQGSRRGRPGPDPDRREHDRNARCGCLEGLQREWTPSGQHYIRLFPSQLLRQWEGDVTDRRRRNGGRPKGSCPRRTRASSGQRKSLERSSSGSSVRRTASRRVSC